MNKSLKTLFRQITPPILLPLGKELLSVFRLRLPPVTEPRKNASALKDEYDRLNVLAEADQIVLRDGLSLRIHPESRNAFEHFAYISPEMVDELDCFIAHTKDKSRFLDIGALHGIFSLVFAANSPAKRVVAVDASPLAFARLLYNIHRNGFSNITPVECAISAHPGTLRMHYEWEHAVAANTDAGGSGQQLLSVARRTGDELCESLSFEPDVIKIDVEGHEIQVVKGLAKVLKTSHPIVFLELHPGRIAQEGGNLDNLLQVFATSGYTASFVDGRALSIKDIPKFSTDQRVLLRPS